MTKSKICRALAHAVACQIDASDVGIEKIELPECDKCNLPATRNVTLDLRNCGTTITVATMCQWCAKDFAKRLKASLPTKIQ